MIGANLIIMAKNCSLPVDEEEKQQLMHNLYAVMEPVLNDYQIAPEQVMAYDNNIYSEVPACCPDCGQALTIIEIEAGPKNGASASASCGCGWHGRAVYRLIDLEETNPQQEFNQQTSVNQGQIDPRYAPYQHTDWYYLKQD